MKHNIFSNMGLFWQDTRTSAGRIKPPIPETTWLPVTDFPLLKHEKILSIDTETYDPQLLQHGPGWARHVGHMVGVSVATVDNKAWYFPMRHEEQAHLNLDPVHVLSWLNDTITHRDKTIRGANLTYDLGWLREEGVRVTGKLEDCQFAEAILSSGSKVGLDHLGEKYCGITKVKDALYDWCLLAFGGSKTEQRGNIYRAPVTLAGVYAEMDAVLPNKIMQKQLVLLNKDKCLYDLFRMECDLIYLMLDMRFEGVHVDMNKADQLRSTVITELNECDNFFKTTYGYIPNVNASASLATLFDKVGLKYPITDKGNASFTKEYLTTVDHDVAKQVLQVKQLQKLKTTFLEGAILESQVNGKIHCSFHQLKNDSNGAVTGRFASSAPNLQNIPSRSELGKKVRTIFIPPKGSIWRRFDYSQVEYRCLGHFAQGDTGYGIRQMYTDDPNTDFHQATIDLVQNVVGYVLGRKPAKTLNFGLCYGMGKAKLASSLNLTLEQTDELFTAYHTGVPFVKATMKHFTTQAEIYGEVRTFHGRRTVFDKYVPKEFGVSYTPLPLPQAMRAYVGKQLQRAGLHKALNYTLQGTAADIIKFAMLECYQQGLFKNTGVPTLQVHDELNFNDSGGFDRDFKLIKQCMEQTTKLRVPIIVDEERGSSWGDTVEVDDTDTGVDYE